VYQLPASLFDLFQHVIIVEACIVLYSTSLLTFSVPYE